MYTYKIGIPAEEHDRFVKQHPQNNLLQSSSWAKVKDNWGNERVGFYQDQTLVAVASILIQPLPLGWTMMYIPRGPIMDYTDQELVFFVLQSLKKIAKKHRTVFIKFDPSIYFQQYLINQTTDDKPDATASIQLLKQAGCDWVGRTDSLAETIQPRFQANIYKEYFADELLSKNTRQTIRTAQNKDVTIQYGQLELLNDFATLMKKTESRKNIHLRNKDYYAKLLEQYPEQSFITLATLDLATRSQKLQAKLQTLQKEAELFSDKTKEGKRKQNASDQASIQDEMSFLQNKIAQGITTAPLAGTLTLVFGQAAENIYAGMDEEYRRYQPAILTWYQTATYAFEQGVNWINLGGVENQLDGGLYHFKSKFNPMIEEFIGEWNYPTSPLYPLFNLAYKLRKILRSKKN
ncbi:aminoacyltransferase [Streptococcus marmotae]|uniref:aminoacyltransferase n=1 Tax=Streptococcus marmotae TaxID=1825069 RepID=UPI00082D2255|nr:aminoacyltransferase [Streptococcus marmotae]